MKKYFFCNILLIFSIYTLHSQVGVNTESPGGALHVKSRTLPAGNNGVLVGSDGNDGISVAIDDTSHPSASVSLGASNKAFMPNLVALVDARGNAVGNPIQNPVDGMVVYNTARAGTVPDNVTPGLYVYNANENRWLYCITEESSRVNYSFTLADALSLKRMATYSNTNFLDNSDALELITGTSLSANSIIEIGSDAAYAVALNLSGSIPNSTGSSYQRMVVYAAVVLLNNDGTKTILDIAQINPAGFNGSDRKVTYPVTLGFNARRGDRISILISALNVGPVWTLLPGETLVVFWKV